MPSRPTESQLRIAAALVCGLAGFVVFQWFGNATRGYIDTSSLFWWWVYQWINPASETQHGWLVLGIAAWVWWRNLGNSGFRNPNSGVCKAAESQVSHRGSRDLPWFGYFGIRNPESGIRPEDSVGFAFFALAGGLVLHALGFVAQQARVSILALLLFAWGVVRLGGGERWGRAAVFPLGFLIFAIPVNVLDTVGFWLRVWVIDVAAPVARALGVNVVQSGTQLMGPDGRYNYDVAAACSGVRSLMALAALSLVIGYLMFRTWWRRGLLLLLCFPLIYVGNLARIGAIIGAAQLGGERWGNVAHDVMGWGVFAIVLGGVWLVAEVMLKRWPEAADSGFRLPDSGVEARESGDRKPETGERKAEMGSFGIRNLNSGNRVAVVVVVLAAAECGFLRHVASIPPRAQVGVYLAPDGLNPVELPAFIGRDWVGWPAAVTPVERDILPPDTGYSRMTYIPSRGRRTVFLSIVLSGRDRSSIHRPELCLVGQGWTIEEAKRHRFRSPAHPGGANAAAGPGFEATVLRVSRQGPERKPTNHLIAYWFVGGDRVVPTNLQRMAWDAWNRVSRGRADRWAYVLIQTDAEDGEAPALQRMEQVLAATLPVFQKTSGNE